MDDSAGGVVLTCGHTKGRLISTGGRKPLAERMSQPDSVRCDAVVVLQVGAPNLVSFSQIALMGLDVEAGAVATASPMTGKGARSRR